MDFSTYFPIWDKLTPAQQKKIEDGTYYREVPKGMILHSGETNCLGIVLIQSGQLRAYTISSEGREVTLYRLFEMDTCIFIGYFYGILCYAQHHVRHGHRSRKRLRGDGDSAGGLQRSSYGVCTACELSQPGDLQPIL